MTCACGCGRVWRPLNKLRTVHPECKRARRNAIRSEQLMARYIETKWQQARAQRRAA